MIPPTPPSAHLTGAAEPDTEEMQAARFLARLRGTRPIATFAVLGALAGIFALEVAFGGSDASPTLAHMGANVVARTRAGELERVLSASALHAGPVHAAMNLYVLFALGRVMEALVGRARFLVLYVLGALGGGIGTTLASGATLSVGASGAMWGLLGAMGVLAFRPGRLLPARAIPGWRRMALTNLGLNVLVSLTPGIDQWAHLGGGIAGALLVGSGALTAGLSLDEPAASSRFTGIFRGLGALLCMALVLSVGVAWARGRPWELVTEPAFGRRVLAEAGVSVEVPEVLPPEIGAEPTTYGTSYSFGSIPTDPYVLLVLALPRPAPLADVAARSAVLESQRAEIESFDPADGAVLLGPPTHIAPGGHPGISRSWRYDNGLLYHRIVVLTPSHDVLLEVVAWEAYEGSAAIGARAAGSVAPL